MLEGYGLITCAHVLAPESVFLYSSLDPLKKYLVTNARLDTERDVAILEAAGIPTYKELRKGDSTKVHLHDPVTLLGFPEHHKGDPVSVHRGEVTAERRVRLGQSRILISAPIVGGNSGGPVLDSRNRVIGIAATGADRFENTTATTNYGVIPIEALADFFEEIQSPKT
jgi:RNA-directed DNA polymerase